MSYNDASLFPVRLASLALFTGYAYAAMAMPTPTPPGRQRRVDVEIPGDSEVFFRISTNDRRRIFGGAKKTGS